MKNKKVLIGAGVLVVVLAGGAYFIAPSLLGSGVIFELSDRVVNLAEGGDQSFAKVKLALEFEVEFEEAGVGKVIAVLEDCINAEISSRTSTDLATIEGKDELKQSILEHANEIFKEHLAPVTFVYLVQFVMQ